MRKISVLIVLIILILTAPWNTRAQQVNSHWQVVRTPVGYAGYLRSFVAFDDTNLLIFVAGPSAKVYYSSDRGVAWIHSSLPAVEGKQGFISLDHVGGVALLTTNTDSSDYESQDFGRTWIRHPWRGADSTVAGSHPYPKRWLEVGKAWYESIIIRDFNPTHEGTIGSFYFLRQSEPFGRLKLQGGMAYDLLNHDYSLWDAEDSNHYASVGGRNVFFGEGGSRTEFRPSRPGGFVFQYLSEHTWLYSGYNYDSPLVMIFRNLPKEPDTVTQLPYHIEQVFSTEKTVIARFTEERYARPGGAEGAYISRDRGSSWAELPYLEEGKHSKVSPLFYIVDSLRIFMVYNDTLYYTSDGGGPTIPLASVAAARDARPGVAVFGSVLSVSGGGEVDVLDLLGRRVVRAERSASGEPVKINLLPYPDGIYFVRSGQGFTKILWQRE